MPLIISDGWISTKKKNKLEIRQGAKKSPSGVRKSPYARPPLSELIQTPSRSANKATERKRTEEVRKEDGTIITPHEGEHLKVSTASRIKGLSSNIALAAGESRNLSAGFGQAPHEEASNDVFGPSSFIPPQYPKRPLQSESASVHPENRGTRAAQKQETESNLQNMETFMSSLLIQHDPTINTNRIEIEKLDVARTNAPKNTSDPIPIAPKRRREKRREQAERVAERARHKERPDNRRSAEPLVIPEQDRQDGVIEPESMISAMSRVMQPLQDPPSAFPRPSSINLPTIMRTTEVSTDLRTGPIVEHRIESYALNSSPGQHSTPIARPLLLPTHPIGDSSTARPVRKKPMLLPFDPNFKKTDCSAVKPGALKESNKLSRMNSLFVNGKQFHRFTG